MEARVHKNLSSFLAQHSLQDTVSNIDDIVLSYLLGVLDLIGQGEVEDCFDLEDVMDMMNAYLPGFDRIERSTVMDWIFNVATRLKEPEQEPTGVKEVSASDKEKEEEENADDDTSNINIPPSPPKHSSFPLYDYKNCGSGEQKLVKKGNCINGKDPKQNVVSYDEIKEEKQPRTISTSKDSTNKTVPALPPAKEKDKDQKGLFSKRKKRYLSCSSQDSLEDSSKGQVEVQVELDEFLVKDLLEMFPATCSMEAQHCLHVSNGDLNVAAQLIMDRQESGQGFSSSHSKAAKQKNQRKSKKNSDIKLDDETVKSCVLEKYSFYDVAEDEKTHKPPPLKNEAKKLVRYRDGQIVSMKGERFSEIKKSS